MQTLTDQISKVHFKVRQLLARASATDSPAERRSARAKAHVLAERYGLAWGEFEHLEFVPWDEFPRDAFTDIGVSEADFEAFTWDVTWEEFRDSFGLYRYEPTREDYERRKAAEEAKAPYEPLGLEEARALVAMGAAARRAARAAEGERRRAGAVKDPVSGDRRRIQHYCNGKPVDGYTDDCPVCAASEGAVRRAEAQARQDRADDAAHLAYLTTSALWLDEVLDEDASFLRMLGLDVFTRDWTWQEATDAETADLFRSWGLDSLVVEEAGWVRAERDDWLPGQRFGRMPTWRKRLDALAWGGERRDRTVNVPMGLPMGYRLDYEDAKPINVPRHVPRYWRAMPGVRLDKQAVPLPLRRERAWWVWRAEMVERRVLRGATDTSLQEHKLSRLYVPLYDAAVRRRSSWPAALLERVSVDAALGRAWEVALSHPDVLDCDIGLIVTPAKWALSPFRVSEDEIGPVSIDSQAARDAYLGRGSVALEEAVARLEHLEQLPDDVEPGGEDDIATRDSGHAVEDDADAPDGFLHVDHVVEDMTARALLDEVGFLGAEILSLLGDGLSDAAVGRLLGRTPDEARLLIAGVRAQANGIARRLGLTPERPDEETVLRRLMAHERNRKPKRLPSRATSRPVPEVVKRWEEPSPRPERPRERSFVPLLTSRR